MEKFVSALTPEECLARLWDRTDLLWKPFGTKPLVGYAVGRWFLAAMRYPGRNAWRPCAYLHLQPVGGETGVTVRTSFGPFVRLFEAGSAAYLVYILVFATYEGAWRSTVVGVAFLVGMRIWGAAKASAEKTLLLTEIREALVVDEKGATKLR